MPMIAIDNVSKWYGQFQVLTDCTTNVDKGEVIGGKLVVARRDATEFLDPVDEALDPVAGAVRTEADRIARRAFRILK